MLVEPKYCIDWYWHVVLSHFSEKWTHVHKSALKYDQLPVFVCTDPSRYCTLHCTGYMQSWPSSQQESEGDTEKETLNLTCLVMVCRLLPPTSHQPSKDIVVKPSEFVARYAIDGKFTFVDQRWVSSSAVSRSVEHLIRVTSDYHVWRTFSSRHFYQEPPSRTQKMTESNFAPLSLLFFSGPRQLLVICHKKFSAHHVTNTSTRMTCVILQKNTGKVMDQRSQIWHLESSIR